MTPRERLVALDGADEVVLAQRGNDRVEVRKIMHFDIDLERHEAAVTMDEVQVYDVGMLDAEHARHRAERARDVADDDRQAGRAAIRTFAPGQIEPISVDAACERVAADDVDFDFLVLAAQADDAVGGRRRRRLSRASALPSPARR